MKQASFYALFLALALPPLGCGKASSGTGSSSFFPSMDFTLPPSVVASNTSRDASHGLEQSAALAPVSGSNVLSRWAFRIDRIISYTNQILTKLNEKNVSGKGAFTKELAGGTLKGNVTELSGDTDYAYEGVFCLNDKKALHLKWSSDGAKIYFLRDFNVDPAGHGNPKELKVEGTYVEGASDTTVQLNVYGTPWSVPTDVVSHANGGSYLGEYVAAVKASDGSFTIKGVNAWENAARTASNQNDAFVGDAWGTGKIKADGTGDYVVYRIFSSLLCTGSFDQTSSLSPGWCFSGSFAADGTVTFSVSNLSTLWSSSALQPIGIAQSSSVKFVDFASTVSCPQ